MEHNPDLLWALKGGGGNFGVVTDLELALHPVGPTVFAGAVLHTYDHAEDAIALWRDTMTGAPDELSLGCAIVTVPAEPPFPEHLHGHLAVLIVGMWSGEPEDGERALAPLRAYGPPALDLFGPMPYVDFQSLQEPPAGARNYWTSEHLAELPDEAIAEIVAHAWAQPPGETMTAMFCWGGAVSRIAPSTSPLAGRDARWVVHPLVLWDAPDDDAENMAYGRAFRDILAPWSTGTAYGNFTGHEGRDRVRAGFVPGAYERLARIKMTYDPGNVFAANHNIRPAA
jgi:FAD/FMN-containing dehydrogenase